MAVDHTAAAHDYTREDDSVPFDIPDDGIGDYEIAPVQTINKSADQIQQERSFNEIPPGDHELIVLGFVTAKGSQAPVKSERKDAYVRGKRVGFVADSIIVKFGLVRDTSFQVTDYFLLPPADPVSLEAYYEGLPKIDAKATQKGFMASKFYHFIERLGFPYPKGGHLPGEARRLANWRGRRIHATVIAGDDYADQTTGETKAGRPQIKLFSYRASGASLPPRQGEPSRYPHPLPPSADPIHPVDQEVDRRGRTPANGGAGAPLQPQLHPHRDDDVPAPTAPALPTQPGRRPAGPAGSTQPAPARPAPAAARGLDAI